MGVYPGVGAYPGHYGIYIYIAQSAVIVSVAVIPYKQDNRHHAVPIFKISSKNDIEQNMGGHLRV